MAIKDVNPRLQLTSDEVFDVYWSTILQRYPELDFPSRPSLGELEALIQLYQGSPVFIELRQAKALVSKVPGKGRSLKEAALRTWYLSEEMCRNANQSIPLLGNASTSPLAARLDRARALILGAIGEFTPRKYHKICALAYDGPGVSLSSRDRRRTAPVYKALKAHTQVTSTPAAATMAIDYYRERPLCLRRELDARISDSGKSVYGVHLTPSNRVGFVPKSSSTFRSIAIEPLVNLRFQLGVHRFLAPILEKRRISFIEDQRVNQLLAKLGSKDPGLFSLSTIDLSAASDTISYELVRRLLPESWFQFLCDLRCESSIVDGTEVRLEKFSSMGNGFTFVLESLVFWSLSEACRLESNAGLLTVTYGDDIICPTASALLLIETLEMVGLKVNTEKSFILGSFKESCGADWDRGELVTPVYVRESVLRPSHVHGILNHFGVIGKCAPLRDFLLKRYSETRPLIFGLENEDPTSCIFTTLGYLKGIGQARWSPSLQNYRFRGLTTIGRKFTEDEETAYLSALLGAGTRNTPIRKSASTRLRWMTAGRPVGTQLLMS